MIVFPLLLAAICAVFGVQVLKQYQARRKPYQGAWGASLLIAAGSGLAYTFMKLAGNDPILFKIYYLLAAVLAAPYMGLGSVFLAAPGKVARVTAWLVHLLSALGAALIALAPINTEALDALALGSGVGVLEKGGWLAVLVLLNAFGALAVVGVALLSVVRLLGERASKGYVAGNVLIAVGIIIVSSAGSMARLGAEPAFWLTMVAGYAVTYGGFLAISRASETTRGAVDSAA